MVRRGAALAMLALSFSTSAMAQTADERIEQLEYIVGEQDARIRELEALIRDRLGETAQGSGAENAADTAAATSTNTRTPVFESIVRPEIVHAQPLLGGESSPLQVSADYHYRPRNAIDAGPNDPADWLNRLRFNFLVRY